MIFWKCSLLLLLLSIWTVNGSDYEAFMKHIQSQVVPHINKSVDLNSGTTAIVQVFQWHQIPGQMVVEELKWTTKLMEVYMKHRGISQGLAFVIRGQGKDISLHTRDLVTGQSRTYQALAPNYHVAGLLYFTEQYEFLNSHTVTLKNGETGEEVKYDTVISYVQPSDVSFRKLLYSSFASMIDKSVDLYSGKTAIVQVFQWQMFSNSSFVSEELKWDSTRMDVYVRDGSPYQGLAFVIRGQGDYIGFNSKDIATGQVMESHTYAPTYRVASFGYVYKGTRQFNDSVVTLKNERTGEEVKYDTIIHYVDLKDQTTTVAPTTTTTLSSEEVSFRKNLMELIDSKVDKSIDLYSGNTSFVHVFHWQTYQNPPYLVLEKLNYVEYQIQQLDIYVKDGCKAQGLAFVFRGQGNNFKFGTKNHITNKFLILPTYLPTYHVASIDYLNHSAISYNSSDNYIYLKNEETKKSDFIDIHYIRPEDQTTTVAPTTTTTLSSEEVSFRKNLMELINSNVDESIDLYSGNTSFVNVFHWQTYENQPYFVLEEYKIVEYQKLDIYVKDGCTSQGLAFVFRGQGNNFTFATRNYLTNKFLKLPTYLPIYHVASIDYLNHSAYSKNFTENDIYLKNQETGEKDILDIHYIRPEDQTTTVAPTTITTLSPEEVSFRKNLMELIDSKVDKSIDLYSGNTSFVNVFHWQTYENQPYFVLKEYKLVKYQRLDVYVKEGCASQGLAFVFRGQGNNFTLGTWNHLTNKPFNLPTYLPTYHVASIDYLNHSAYFYNSTENRIYLRNQETKEGDQLDIHYIRPEDQTTTVAPTDSPSEILGFPLSSIEGMIAPLISKSIDLHSGKTNIRQIMQWDKSEDGTLSFKQIMWQVTEITVFVKRNITDQGLAFVIQGTGDRFSVTLKSEETGAETTREANLLNNRVVMIPFGENGQKMVDETLRFTLENLGTGMKHTYQQVIRLARKSFIHSD